MEEDYFHLGGQVYEVEKQIKGYNFPYIDGRNIIFTTAANKGRKELDNMMQSLVADDYREMKDDVIKGCVMYYKTTQDGDDKVCEAVHNYAVKYAQKSYNEGKDDGINIGISKGTVKTLLNLVNSGAITLDYAIANSGLDKEKFISIAESLGYKL